MQEILIASSNKGKLKEFDRLLSPLDLKPTPQASLGIEDAVEDGLSFVENAIKKARHACKESNLPAIADDSGLDVPALGGAPGIYSARYSGNGATDDTNNLTLLENMSHLTGEERRACFRCVLVYMHHAEDPTPLICQGNWWGHIIDTPSGANGFGYDPLFFVAEHGCTSAELSPELKNSISHRGQAMSLLIEGLRGLPHSPILF